MSEVTAELRSLEDDTILGSLVFSNSNNTWRIIDEGEHQLLPVKTGKFDAVVNTCHLRDPGKKKIQATLKDINPDTAEVGRRGTGSVHESTVGFRWTVTRRLKAGRIAGNWQHVIVNGGCGNPYRKPLIEHLGHDRYLFINECGDTTNGSLTGDSINTSGWGVATVSDGDRKITWADGNYWEKT